MGWFVLNFIWVVGVYVIGVDGCVKCSVELKLVVDGTELFIVCGAVVEFVGVVGILFAGTEVCHGVLGSG